MAPMEVKRNRLMDITLKPLSTETVETYVSVGIVSYNEHYPHLWENEDTSPYINKNFTKKVVENDLKDSNIGHFLVMDGQTCMGLVKLVYHRSIDGFSSEEALLAEKIYLLKAYSGMGVGKKVLQLIEGLAKRLNKRVIWLDTMKKGNPIHFYLKNGFQIIKEGEVTLDGAIPAEKAMWVLTKQL